jgi:N-acetylmuramoyl-L-alanine amidase
MCFVHFEGFLPFLCQKAIVFAFVFIAGVSFPVKGQTKSIVKTIVIDPGHGGKDPGNLGTKRYKTTEKDVVLDISLRVGDYLKKAFPDLQVLYTRKDDSFLKLNERTEFANKNNADLFISIHCNANESNRPRGADTWVMGPHKNQANLKVAQKENASILLEDNYQEAYGSFDPNSPETYLALSLRQNVHLNESLILAQMIQDEFRTRVGRIDRGVKQSGFYVISFTTMPSVLIETGFLTNPDEEDFLNSEKGKDYMASAIYRAVKKYIISVENIPDNEVITLSSTGTVQNVKDKKHEYDTEQEIETENIPEQPVASAIDGQLNYRIQLLISTQKISIKEADFRGLDPISVVQVGEVYKYYYSRVGNYSEAKHLRDVAVKSGFKEAFVVSFKDETRIDLQEALTLEHKSFN